MVDGGQWQGLLALFDQTNSQTPNTIERHYTCAPQVWYLDQIPPGICLIVNLQSAFGPFSLLLLLVPFSKPGAEHVFLPQGLLTRNNLYLMCTCLHNNATSARLPNMLPTSMC
jgi:hypothetical protein